MIDFFYSRFRSGNPRETWPAVLFCVVAVWIIAVPFVDLLIWVLLNWFGFELEERTVYLVMAPMATMATVGLIVTPVLFLWSRMLKEVHEQSEDAQISRAKAEDLLAQRSEFIAYVSHEIRNPLNAILGLSSTMDRANLSDDQCENIEMISSNSQDLLYILNDLLDISKMDEGQVKLNPSEISLRANIEELYKFWKARAHEKGIQFEMTICETFPDYVRLDAQRFRQVLNNLISNAIKYCDEGSVVVSADCDYQNQKALISVLDTGIGIPPSLREMIFSPYQQVESEDSSGPRKMGTGLGLSIARNLARLMGGDVFLLDSSSAGSKFQFAFEVEPIEKPASVSVSEEDLKQFLKGKSVLIVDDSLASSIVAREYLSKLGLRHQTVHSGDEALEALKNEEFDFVVLDDDLGDITSRDVIKSRPHDKGIYIAYSGRVFEDEKENFMEMGFHGHVGKPAQLDDFKEEFARICFGG